MNKHNALIVFSSYKRIDENNKNEILSPFIVPKQVDYRRILKSLPIFPSTAIVHQKKLGKHFFNERMGSLRDDYVFWLSLLRTKVKYAYGNKEILAAYRMRNDSVTADKQKVVASHWEVFRKVENFSMVRSMYYMGWWVWISFWKYIR